MCDRCHKKYTACTLQDGWTVNWARAGRVILSSDVEMTESEKMDDAMLNIATLRCLVPPGVSAGEVGEVTLHC